MGSSDKPMFGSMRVPDIVRGNNLTNAINKDGSTRLVREEGKTRTTLMSPVQELTLREDRLNYNNVIERESKDEVYRDYSRLFTYTIARDKNSNDMVKLFNGQNNPKCNDNKRSNR
jgi:hypothetical protein